MQPQIKVLIESTDNKPGRLYVIDQFTPDLYEQFIDLELEDEPKCRTGYQRRDVGFFSDMALGYKYSGQIMRAAPLEGLSQILAQVNTAIGADFNAILVNRYIDGTKYISAHSDDESALVSDVIATLAYGAVRKFRIRDKIGGGFVMDVPHTPGMLIVMDQGFQQSYTHEIPVEKRILDARVSLTFRSHMVDKK